MKEYYNEDAGVIRLGDTVWLRDEHSGIYREKFLIIEEYANMYKAQDLEHPSALQLYVTKDTFDLVNGDGGIKPNKDKGETMRWFKRRKKGGDAPLISNTVASKTPLNQPAGSGTGPVKTETKVTTPYHKGKYGGTYTDSYGGGWFSTKANCHKGNTIIATRSVDNLRNHLMVGGWSREAYTTDDMTIVDLTGFGKSMSDKGKHWYTIKIKDYDVPDWNEFFWRQLSELAYFHLASGDVLLACQGGHGRSGMTAAIVAGLLQDKADFDLIDGKKFFDNPLSWIRKVHCHHAVETYAQEKMVLEVLMHFYPTSVRLAEAWMQLKKPKRKQSQYAYDDKYRTTKDKIGKAVDTGKCPDCGRWYNSTCKTCNPPPDKAHEKKYNPVKVGQELQDLDEWEKKELDWLDDWAEEDFKKKKSEEEEEGEKFLCPICLTPHETPSEAVLCCNSKGHNQFCPICGTWCRTPLTALEHCDNWQEFKVKNDGLLLD